MTATAKINKRTLTVGDYIGFDMLAQHIDGLDSMLWCKITDVVSDEGFRAYRVCFPDGEPMRRTILAKYVGRFKTAADAALDNADIAGMMNAYKQIALSNIAHDFMCDCGDCRKEKELSDRIAEYYGKI